MEDPPQSPRPAEEEPPNEEEQRPHFKLDVSTVEHNHELRFQLEKEHELCLEELARREELMERIVKAQRVFTETEANIEELKLKRVSAEHALQTVQRNPVNMTDPQMEEIRKIHEKRSLKIQEREKEFEDLEEQYRHEVGSQPQRFQGVVAEHQRALEGFRAVRESLLAEFARKEEELARERRHYAQALLAYVAKHKPH